ncbi:hypothetical protein [Phenylobacterium sp.]|uniref:hypothetical protein n=1 Tax=Phenylobacterium sp. TaxID=1871053 RepID=UPI002F3F79DC
MTELSRARFEALAEAYGGDVARWPAGVREDAAAVMAGDPAFARGVLAQASLLDAVLDDWTPPPVRHGLREAILAAAPRPRARSRLAVWGARLGLGAALAGACASGVAAGVMLSAAVGDGDAVSAVMTGYEGVGDEATAVGDV